MRRRRRRYESVRVQTANWRADLCVRAAAAREENAEEVHGVGKVGGRSEALVEYLKRGQ